MMEPKVWALMKGYELKSWLSSDGGYSCDVTRRIGKRSLIVCNIYGAETEEAAIEDAITWIKNYERITNEID